MECFENPDKSSVANIVEQYVAFAGLATVLNLFVSEYHLSDERNAVVLGVDRGNPGPSDQPGREVDIPLETSGRQRDENQQHTLRNRGA